MAIQREGYKPDEIIYNNLLYGCCIPLKDFKTPIHSRKGLADQILLGMMENKVSIGFGRRGMYVLVRLWHQVRRSAST